MRGTGAVNSHNEWVPLEEVVVGTARGAAKIAFEPVASAYYPDRAERRRRAAPRSAADIDAAEAQLDNLANVLQKEGVIVRRPSPMDFSAPVRTPTFEALSQNAAACPRDVLLVIGGEIIEAPMAFRSRFFEYLPYRALVKAYFRDGARWTAAPKPSMDDALYEEDYSIGSRRFHADDHPALTDYEPCFDAASFARCGRDLFYQPDLVTNDFGAQWLARHLGEEYRVHRVRFDDSHPPQHIDATMVPLRPGLVMVNPERPAVGDDMKIFTDSGWEVVQAVPSLARKPFPTPEVSNWISMNVFNIDEKTIIAEEQETPTIRLLESLGFRVIALPFSHVYSFGGSFHCCTLDVRRRGTLQSYFPSEDAAERSRRSPGAAAAEQPHSVERLGATRDFWWNADFMALMARRWELEDVRSVLDVGSGVGHWGRMLLPYLPPGVAIDGVDPEPRWVARAAESAAEDGLAARLRYTSGSADRLPFADATFDMVTCQTVLVHVADVRRALREMIRVLRPGGLLAVAEPNNLVFTMLLGRTRSHEDVQTTLDLARLQLVCERGKEALGEGSNSIGDLLPGYFNECGLSRIAVYQSDRATPLFPPYDDPAQRANRDELLDLTRREVYVWPRDDAARYFRAGGGSSSEFDALWTTALDVARAVARGLRENTEHQAGGSAFYLVSGRRPR